MRAWLTRRGSVRVEVQAARESSSMRGAVPRVMERSKDREGARSERRRWTQMGDGYEWWWRALQVEAD